MKKYRGLIISVAFALVLLGVIVLLLQTEPTNTDPPAPSSEPGMISVYTAPAELVSIDLTNPSGSFSFVARGGTWYLLPDENTPVLSNGIAGLTAVLSQIEAVEQIEADASDLSAYGLDAPGVVAVCTLSDGTQMTLKLGDNIFNAKYYFTLDDNTVYTMDMFDAGVLLADISAYRDMSLVKFTAEEITNLVYQKNGVRYEVVLRDAEALDPNKADSLFAYELKSPVTACAAPNAVKTLIDDVRTLASKGYVVDPQGADFGLTGETYLTVTSASGQVLGFVVGNNLNEQSVYVQKVGETGVYIVDSRLLDFLDTDAFTLVDKHVSLHYLTEISRIDIVSQTKSTQIVTTPDNYTVNGAQVDYEALQTFFQDLISLSYDGRQEVEYDRTTPTVEIVLTKTDGTVDAARYYEYDALSYAVEKDGVTGFLIQKKFVDKIVDAF